MIPARILNARAWADRYRLAVGGLGGSATARGRAALDSEIHGLLTELVGQVAMLPVLPEDIERPELLTLVSAVRFALDLSPPPDPAPMVPLRELTDLARAMLEMRRVQVAYFEAKRRTPHTDHRGAYQHSRQTADKAETMARAALNRERASLPGMEDEE